MKKIFEIKDLTFLVSVVIWWFVRDIHPIVFYAGVVFIAAWMILFIGRLLRK